jgi:hypothetical protein
MKYFAMVLRVLIVLVGFKLMSMGWAEGWTPQTAPFCSGIGFILVGLYLSLQAMFWPKALLCPLGAKCRKNMGCKSEK